MLFRRVVEGDAILLELQHFIAANARVSRQDRGLPERISRVQNPFAIFGGAEHVVHLALRSLVLADRSSLGREPRLQLSVRRAAYPVLIWGCRHRHLKHNFAKVEA
jgi:hypothetical protein